MYKVTEEKGRGGILLSKKYNQGSAPNSLGKISRLTKFYNLAAQSGRGENSLREKCSRASHNHLIIFQGLAGESQKRARSYIIIIPKRG